MPIIKLSLLALFLVVNLNVFAQEELENTEKPSKHSIKLLIAHTLIPEGRRVAGDESLLIIPNWGLDYDYNLTPKWTLGLHFDIEIMNYVLEPHHDEFIVRDNPLVLALVTQYNVWDKLWMGVGVGYEKEIHLDLWLMRLAMEYEVPIRKGWSVGPSLTWDYKENYTSAISLGVSVGKGF